MAESHGIIGAMISFGFPPGSGTQARHDRGGVTADGGRYSPIDRMIDHDQSIDRADPVQAALQVGAKDGRARRDRLLRSRKSFQVTENSRRGGSGLFHGDEGEDK